MRIHRKDWLRIVEMGAAGLVLLDVVLYFAVVRPLANSIAEERQRFVASRRQIQAEETRAAYLEKAQATLPSTNEEMKNFLKQHVPPRRRGFSRAAKLVRKLTEDSGVQLSSIGYRLDSEHREPLERLGIRADVQGPFPNLFRFAHGMETTSDLILVRGFSLEPGENGMLTLRLAADLYVTP